MEIPEVNPPFSLSFFNSTKRGSHTNSTFTHSPDKPDRTFKHFNRHILNCTMSFFAKEFVSPFPGEFATRTPIAATTNSTMSVCDKAFVSPFPREFSTRTPIFAKEFASPFSGEFATRTPAFTKEFVSPFAGEFATRTPIAASTINQKTLYPAPLCTEEQHNKNENKRFTAGENGLDGANDGKPIYWLQFNNRSRVWVTREADTEEDRLRREAKFSKEMEGIDTFLKEKREEWELKEKESEKALADLECALKFRTVRSLASHFLVDEPPVFSRYAIRLYGSASENECSRTHLDFERAREDSCRGMLQWELKDDRRAADTFWWGAKARMEIIDRETLLPRLNAKREQIDAFFGKISAWLDSIPSVEECIPYYAGATEKSPKPAWQDVKRECTQLLFAETPALSSLSSVHGRDEATETAATKKNDRRDQLSVPVRDEDGAVGAANVNDRDAKWLNDGWAYQCQYGTKEDWARYAAAQKVAKAKAGPGIIDTWRAAELKAKSAEAAALRNAVAE